MWINSWWEAEKWWSVDKFGRANRIDSPPVFVKSIQEGYFYIRQKHTNVNLQRKAFLAMKLLTLIFFASVLTQAFSQPVDTLVEKQGGLYSVRLVEYYDNGHIQKVSYYTKSKQTVENPKDKMELFMRNISTNDINGTYFDRLDSMKTYYKNSKIKLEDYNNSKAESYRYAYDEKWRLTYIEKQSGHGTSYLYGGKSGIEINKPYIRVEGKSGSIIRDSIVFINHAPHNKVIQLNGSRELVLPTSLILHPKKAQNVEFGILAKPGDQETKLQIFVDDMLLTSIPTTILGYDLSDDDFSTNTDTAPLHYFEGRKYIYIKLEGGEKLVNFYSEEGGQAISIPRILNKIELQSLKNGQYTLEIIDLSTDERSYCQIKV